MRERNSDIRLFITSYPGGGGGRGELPYLGYTGTAHWTGYGFLASLSESENLNKQRSERKELRYQVIYHFISRGGRGVGGNSLIWAIRGQPTGQGMVSWPRCPKLGVQFDLNLS